ncbi:MAG: cupredoxin domain-containing protein [Ilumatobacteraceae bacterium]
MKIFQRRLNVVLVSVATSAFLFGCGSSSSSDSTDTQAPSAYGIYGKTEDSTVAPSSAGSQITISGAVFAVTGDVKSADLASVTNNDSFKHTVTSDDGVFDVTVEGGATKSLPSLSPGTYAFHCKIHSTMRGTLTVT